MNELQFWKFGDAPLVVQSREPKFRAEIETSREEISARVIIRAAMQNRIDYFSYKKSNFRVLICECVQQATSCTIFQRNLKHNIL